MEPWLHAIMKLGKRVENRVWAGCSYRGPVLLHASSRVVLRPTKRDPESFGDAVESILEILKPARGTEGSLVSQFAVVGHDRRCAPRWEPAPTLPLGGIVGRARIVDVIADEDQRIERTVRPSRLQKHLDSPWYTGGFALVLADVEPLPFIQWKGSLGFFDVPDDLVSQALAREIHRLAPC